MKIPEQAKKVFTGKIFDVYQWEQDLFDGSKTIFERIKRPDTSLIIPIVSEEIILINDTQPDRKGTIRLPGGRIEKNEDPLTAAKRELVEETGYTGDSWELFRSYEPIDKMDWTIHVFIARNCTKTKEANPDPGEKIEIIQLDFVGFFKTLTSHTNWGSGLCSELLSMDEKGKEEFRRRLFG